MRTVERPDAEEGRLDLATEETRALVDVLAPRPVEQPFGVYVLTADEPCAALARDVERRVFWEAFGNTTSLLDEEYGPYEQASSFICVVDHLRRCPAGMIRVVKASPAGFKTLHDLRRLWGVDSATALASGAPDLDGDSTWDIATLAVGPDYRGAASKGLVSLALYQALSTAGRWCDIEWMVAVLDVVVLELLQTVLQRPFSFFCDVGPIPYLDSASSVPVWGDYRSWRQRLAATDPSSYELLIEGRGLEASVAPPDWAQASSVLGSPVELGEPVPAARHHGRPRTAR